MNATTASATTRMAIHAIRRRVSSDTTSVAAAARRFATTAPKSFHLFSTTTTPLASSATVSISPWLCSNPQQLATTRTAINSTTTTTTHRFFGTASGGGSGKDKPETDAAAVVSPDDPEADDNSTIPPVVVDLDSHSNADLDEYDPYEIVKSFEDTSYYYPPSEETEPQFLADKYGAMTNDELLDSTTIVSEQQHTWDLMMHSPPIRDKNAALPKGTLVGTVVSTKMQKTVNVAIDRYKIHKKYRKRTKYTRKFMAHDEHEVARDGDLVLIVPSQRISKNKHFVLQEILKAKGQL